MSQLIIVWFIIFLPAWCFYLGIFYRILVTPVRQSWADILLLGTSDCQTSTTWKVYDYYHCRSSHWSLQSHSCSTDGLSLLSLTLLTHSFYPFDPLQDYALVHKWPLLQPTVQSCRSVASVCRRNSSRVRGVSVTSLCSIALLCFPLDPSSIKILSEDTYLYFSIFSAVIDYYCFDLQRRNYCCAIFII